MDLFELVTQAQMNLALAFTIKTSETEPAVFLYNDWNDPEICIFPITK